MTVAYRLARNWSAAQFNIPVVRLSTRTKPGLQTGRFTDLLAVFA